MEFSDKKDAHKNPYVVETEEENGSVLFVMDKVDEFTERLRNRLESYGYKTYVAAVIPKTLDSFTYYFYFNLKKHHAEDITDNSNRQSVFFYYNNSHLAKKIASYVKNTSSFLHKVIDVRISEPHYEQDINRITAFIFSSELDNSFLQIHHIVQNNFSSHQKKSVKHEPVYRPQKNNKKVFTFHKLIQPKFWIVTILLTVVMIHLLFLPMLFLSTYFHYQAAKSIEEFDFDTATQRSQLAFQFLNSSRSLYSIVRPTYSLFSASIVPDTIFNVNESANQVVQNTSNASEKISEFVDMYFDGQKTEDQVVYMSQLLTTAIGNVRTSRDYLQAIIESLPWLETLAPKDTSKVETINRIVSNYEFLFDDMDTILGQERQKYLLFFANNRELRPGGGFIGSFAILELENYRIEDLRIYDVYDIDGQLTEFVVPPEPIRDYLNQPYWYLRDSAFSPDFQENYEQAKIFLKETLNEDDFDGAILVTTTAVEYLIEAFGSVSVPDYNEVLTPDNFYLKTQLYAEKDFFPGSRGKKGFLASTFNSMIVNLPNVDPIILSDSILRGFNEKQIVVFFEDRSIQQEIEEQYWAGQTLVPNCTIASDNCLVDYIYQYDANLGVNKANYFVETFHELDVTINEEGFVSNTYAVTYTNNSYENVFPGGTYKNYFQLLLPRNIDIDKIMVDEFEFLEYDFAIKQDYARIGFYFEVDPQATRTVTVEYSFPGKIKKGSGIYQLVKQKQIGTDNADFSLQINLNPNIYVADNNFAPVVNNNQVNYNTTLSTDKIFFIELFIE